MQDLVKRSLAPFGVEDARTLPPFGTDLRLPPQVVVAYALALHELATNASKYGALSNAAGVVDVAWSVKGEPDRPLLHMLWREHGGPPVIAPREPSFGTQLIKRVLATEIGGGSTSTIASTVSSLQPLSHWRATTGRSIPDRVALS